MSGVYLELFHGRKSRLMQMDNWGENGPVLGPFEYVSVTYNSELRVKMVASKESDAIEGELVVVGDMVYYDGYYYGDWSFITEESAHELKNRIQAFSPEKAKHVKRKSGKTRPESEEEPGSICREAGRQQVDPRRASPGAVQPDQS